MGLAALVVGATTVAARPVEVEVRGLRLDPETGSPVVRLVEKSAENAAVARELPIWVGPYEAQAIALALEGSPPPRPLTHDLMKQIVERFGAKLTEVVIEDLRDNTYFATLHFDGPGGDPLTIDARPSDAIALALGLGGRILVAEEVFSKSAASQGTPAALRLWGLTLQNITPEISSFFDVPAARGVLVSDVAATAPSQEVHRGDVITAVDDQPVGSVEDVASHADTRAAASPVRLSVHRAGQDLVLSFASP